MVIESAEPPFCDI